jgi:hypothetical protein
VPTRGLDTEAVRALLAEAERRLTGDWLLVGGALASIWFSPGRVTEVVDLIGLGGTNAERLALMELASSVGLPVEAVNSAADYFVQKTPGWQAELEVLRATERMRILRPTPTLFVVLKIGRLTEQDLDDCLLLLDFAEREGLLVDRERIATTLSALPSTDDAPLRARRSTLLQRLAG